MRVIAERLILRPGAIAAGDLGYYGRGGIQQVIVHLARGQPALRQADRHAAVHRRDEDVVLDDARFIVRELAAKRRRIGA